MWYSGLRFEKELEMSIRKVMPFSVFANLPLYSYKLESITDIDLLLIGGNDVLIVEAKRFPDGLYGSFNDSRWVGASGVNSWYIYSPVFQNLEHLRTLKSYLRRKGINVSSLNFFPCVVVPDSCVLECDCRYVKHYSDFISAICKWGSWKDNEALLSVVKEAYGIYGKFGKH
jgi:hypothetical protein